MADKRELNNTFTFTKHRSPRDGDEIIVNTNEIVLSKLLKTIETFLLASGYYIKRGTLQIVDDHEDEESENDDIVKYEYIVKYEENEKEENE